MNRTVISVAIYLGAIVLANFMILWFGPAVSIVNAFLLIGLDLSLRDHLHEVWGGKGLVWKMGLLILAGSGITVLLNLEAMQIAVASATAFGVAAAGDALVYHQLRDRIFLFRSNGSNIAGSALDSMIFPLMAFGLFPGVHWIILGQFVAKIVGGGIWSWILWKAGGRDAATVT